jgi:cell division protease FtsH
MSPDQFRKITEKISVVDIKDALKKRFRNEQIARLGNIHVIYPSFSEQNFRDIIDLSLNAYKKEAYNLSGYTLDFDDTIKNIIYDEGVYPTHGTRPIFSTVHEIVKSRFPNIIRYICENGFKDTVNTIKYTFDNDTNLIVVYLYDIYGFAISDIKFEIRLRLKKLRDSNINDEEQALCALHESGHFVMYAKLFGKMPEKLVSKTTDTNTGGFLMEDIDEIKKKISKRDMLNEIRVLLGGYVAEKISFGEEMTSGASNDLFRATQLASRLVRRFGMGNNVFVSTNTDAPDDNFGFLLNENNQNYINMEIKQILEDAENDVRITLLSEEWKKMLKESALYLCENSAMPKNKMQEIYDKVADTAKITTRDDRYYHEIIENL